MKKPYISGIIVAAGDGARMGGVIKPLLSFSNKTFLEIVLTQFIKSDIIDEIVVVSKNIPEILNIINNFLGTKPLIFTTGGNTRQESVFNGVSKTSPKSTYVMIHDCARPFIDENIIKSAYECSLKTGASCISKPVTDTIKYRNENDEIKTPKRDRLFAVETPQTFLKDMYLSSYALSLKNNVNFTDETSMVEYAGFKVNYFINDRINMKITTKEDFELAKMIYDIKGV